MHQNYNLDRLGWKNFQHLCGTILRESLGQTYQTFADGNDAGQDGAFWGTWTTVNGERFSGTFTIQCKHTSRADAPFRMSVIRDELLKAKLLGIKGKATNYFLLTNYSISAATAQKVEEAFQVLPGIRKCKVFDRSWIQSQIHESKNLRTLVPRLYGLGDLTQILDNRAREQAQAILKHLGNDFPCFVPTKAHHDSVKALNAKGFVFLLGEPCCGKSTIALSLALASADLWGCTLIRVDKPSHFRDHWNPADPHQFFWVDDAFGTTQYEREMALEWNRDFPALQTAIKRGARVVFTSRDYIYRAAMEDLKEGSFPLLRDSKVVIKVEQITAAEKEQILYNHIKLGRQPKDVKKCIEQHLPAIAAHERFLPETVRRLGDPFFTKGLAWEEDALLNFVDNMKDFLMDTLKTLGNSNRAAVALVFMRKGDLSCDLALDEKEKHALALLGATIGQVKNALIALSPTLLLNAENDGKEYWKFKHPSVRDAFGSFIANDPSLKAIYIENTEIRALLSEIACGITNIEGVKLQVPERLFDSVLARLKELDQNDSADRALIVQFLRNKAGSAFLKIFLDRQPRFLDKLHCSSWMRYDNTTQLVSKIHLLGLLSEKLRKKFAEQISENTVYHSDATCYQSDVGELLNAEEQASLARRVKREVMGRVRTDITYAKERCIEKKLDPYDEFWEVQRDIRSFADKFRYTLSFRDRLDRALQRIEKIIDRLAVTRISQENDLKTDERDDEVEERSIFDDVAE